MRTDTSMVVMLMILLAAILLVVFVSPLMIAMYPEDAHGQTTTTSEKVAEVQQQVQSNNAQIDSTTLIAGGTAAGTIATFLTAYMKSRQQSKENEKLKDSDNRTDKDTGISQLLFYRLIQTMDAMIPEVARCLDQPFNSDPMQKHITIRMKLAEDANATAQYLMTTLNAYVPSMTPAATVIVADAKQQTAAQNIQPQQQLQQPSQTPPPSNTNPPKS